MVGRCVATPSAQQARQRVFHTQSRKHLVSSCHPVPQRKKRLKTAATQPGKCSEKPVPHWPLLDALLVFSHAMCARPTPLVQRKPLWHARSLGCTCCPNTSHRPPPLATRMGAQVELGVTEPCPYNTYQIASRCVTRCNTPPRHYIRPPQRF